MSSGEDEKELMEAIRFLLKTTEELKANVSPLVQGQADILKILKSHEEAITGLMNKLLGTRREHKEQLESLELVIGRVSKVEERQFTHESFHELLEKRLGRVELEPIRQISEKVFQEREVTIADLKVVESYLSLHPDDTYALRTKVEVLDQLGRKDEAQRFLEEAIHRHPGSGRLWYERGLLLEDLVEKLKSFDKCLEIFKDGPPSIQHIVLHSRAGSLAKAKKFDEALDSATKSVELNPECYGAWILKGMILSKLNRMPEALGCFEKATELNSNSGDAWFQKGIALAALNRKDEALASFDRTIDLEPKDAIAYFNKAKLLIAKKMDEEALKTLDKGLEIDNRKACAWCDKGSALNRLGRNDEALQSLMKALELGPPKQCGQVFINMAIVLNCNKRFEEGAFFARKAIELQPEKAMFWSALAGNLKDLSKDEDALKAYEKALYLKKSDEEIDWDDLAELYEKMGKMEEAKQAYEKFESLKKKADEDESTSSK